MFLDAFAKHLGTAATSFVLSVRLSICLRETTRPSFRWICTEIYVGNRCVKICKDILDVCRPRRVYII